MKLVRCLPIGSRRLARRIVYAYFTVQPCS